jgi:hypothetical protein
LGVSNGEVEGYNDGYQMGMKKVILRDSMKDTRMD